uniref:Putative secreted protein n=1 Tax=Anopheles darlingi TaxID=43151 RepID=A0A2M4DNE6_ANODA
MMKMVLVRMVVVAVVTMVLMERRRFTFVRFFFTIRTTTTTVATVGDEDGDDDDCPRVPINHFPANTPPGLPGTCPEPERGFRCGARQSCSFSRGLAAF